MTVVIQMIQVINTKFLQLKFLGEVSKYHPPYSKTMVMIREDPINATTEIAHLTALVRRDNHWLRYNLKN